MPCRKCEIWQLKWWMLNNAMFEMWDKKWTGSQTWSTVLLAAPASHFYTSTKIFLPLITFLIYASFSSIFSPMFAYTSWRLTSDVSIFLHINDIPEMLREHCTYFKITFQYCVLVTKSVSPSCLGLLKTVCCKIFGIFCILVWLIVHNNRCARQSRRSYSLTFRWIQNAKISFV